MTIELQLLPGQALSRRQRSGPLVTNGGAPWTTPCPAIPKRKAKSGIRWRPPVWLGRGVFPPL